MTLIELIAVKYYSIFFSDICHRLDEVERLSFAHYNNGLLIRTIATNPQIVIPHSLKQRVLVLSHYSVTISHPGDRKLHFRIKRHFFWPSFPVDCYATVRNCAECTNCIKLRRNVGFMKLFSATAPLESVSIEKYLCVLIRTLRGHKYIPLITYCFTKLVKAIPLKGVSAGEVATFAYLRSYIEDHHRGWDLYTPARTYIYNSQPKCSNSSLQDSPIASPHPQSPPMIHNQASLSR